MAISISDLVRSDRYNQLTPSEKWALGMTIAGEVDPRTQYGGAPYGTAKNRREIANILQTIENRAKERGLSREQTVKQRKQYSMWNDSKGRAVAKQNLQENQQEITRALHDFYRGSLQPSNTRMDHYYASRGASKIREPGWAQGMDPLAQTNQHRFYGPQVNTAALDAAREAQTQAARLGVGPSPVGPPTLGAAEAVANIFGGSRPPMSLSGSAVGGPSQGLSASQDVGPTQLERQPIQDFAPVGGGLGQGISVQAEAQKPLNMLPQAPQMVRPEGPAGGLPAAVPPALTAAAQRAITPQNPSAAPPATSGLANGSPLSQAPPPAGLPAAGGTAAKLPISPNSAAISPNSQQSSAISPNLPPVSALPPAAPPSPAQGLPVGAQSPAPVPPPNAMAGLPGPAPSNPVPPPSPIMGREVAQPPIAPRNVPAQMPGAITSRDLPAPPGAITANPNMISRGPVVDSIDKRIALTKNAPPALQSPFNPNDALSATPQERMNPVPSPMMGRRQSLSDAQFEAKLPGFADAMPVSAPPPPAPKPPQTSLYQGPFVDQTMTDPVRNMPPIAPPRNVPAQMPGAITPPQPAPTPSVAKSAPAPSLPALENGGFIPKPAVTPATSLPQRTPPAPPAPPPVSEQIVQQQKAPLAAKLAGTALGGVAGLATGGGLLGMLAGGIAGNRLANRFFRGSDGRLRDSSGRLVDDNESRGMGMGMPGGGLGYGNGRGYAGGSIGSGIGGAINPNK